MRKRTGIPFFGRIFIILGVLSGIIWAEKKAPVMTAGMNLKKLVEWTKQLKTKFSS